LSKCLTENFALSSLQVIQAKWKSRKNQTNYSSQKQSPNNVAAEQTQILRLMRMRGEVTLADIVIETNIPVDKVRSLLVELERNDCIRSRNRDSDGGIVYYVV